MMLSIVDDKEVMDYYNELVSSYYSRLGFSELKDYKGKIIDHTIEGYYFNYGITEGIYQYWLKYYYPTCLSFTSFLAIYSGEELPYTTFENTSKTSLKKLTTFIEEQSVEVVRNEMDEISKTTEENDIEITDEDTVKLLKKLGVNDITTNSGKLLKIRFRWKIADKFACKTCKSLDGQIFNYQVDKAHPHCRCHLEVVYDE